MEQGRKAGRKEMLGREVEREEGREGGRLEEGGRGRERRRERGVEEGR